MSEQLGLFGEAEDQVAKNTVAEKVDGLGVQYFDLETQKSAEDVGGWDNIHKMGLAVGVVWDSLDREFFTYEEKDALNWWKSCVPLIWQLDLTSLDSTTRFFSPILISTCRKSTPSICWSM